jgi:hypothetical protein
MLHLANNPTYPDTKVDVGPGTIPDTTGAYDLTLASGVTADLGDTWANGGNLDQGSLAANSSYHIHLISKDSDGSIGVLASASAVNPIIPAGYTARRRLGAVVTDGSGNIRPFRQAGRWFHYNGDPVQDVGVSGAEANGSATLRTMSVPTGIKVWAQLSLSFFGTSAGGYLIVRDPDLGVPAVAGSNGDYFRKTDSNATDGYCWTNTAGQVYTADTGSSPTLKAWTRGWYDDNEAYP